MKKSWVARTQHRLSHKKLSHTALLLPAIILTISTTSAQATYQYTYTGNTFTTSTFAPNWGGEMSCNPDPTAPCISTREEYVSVKFTYPTLLSGSVNLPTNLAFTISTNDVNDPYRNRDLAYPFISPYPPWYPPPGYPPVPPDPLGTPWNPYNIGTFNILSVSSNGLPTDWDISVYNAYNNSHDNVESFIRSSTNQDSTSGTDNRFTHYSGQLDNASGIWTVSAVPEPSTYVLLLLGLSLIAFSARRRNSNYLQNQVEYMHCRSDIEHHRQRCDSSTPIKYQQTTLLQRLTHKCELTHQLQGKAGSDRFF